MHVFLCLNAYIYADICIYRYILAAFGPVLHHHHPEWSQKPSSELPSTCKVEGL